MKQLGSLILFFVYFVLSSANGLAQSSTVSTYVGPALPSSGSQANTQTVGVPQGVSADGTGGFYLSSATQNRIYRVSAAGSLTVIAGNGLIGFSGDDGPATSAQMNYIHGIAADSAGNVFVADTNNNRIRKVSAAGIISHVAGNGGGGVSGNGGAARSAQLANGRGGGGVQAGNGC